jgi:hypothetical protein
VRVLEPQGGDVHWHYILAARGLTLGTDHRAPRVGRRLRHRPPDAVPNQGASRPPSRFSAVLPFDAGRAADRLSAR